MALVLCLADMDISQILITDAFAQSPAAPDLSLLSTQTDAFPALATAFAQQNQDAATAALLQEIGQTPQTANLLRVTLQAAGQMVQSSINDALLRQVTQAAPDSKIPQAVEDAAKLAAANGQRARLKREIELAYMLNKAVTLSNLIDAVV